MPASLIAIGHFDIRNMSVADPFAHTDTSSEAHGAAPDLPSPDTKRWVVRRKAVVVAAVRNGSISLQEACRRYKLSVEEFLAWQRAIDRYGVPGLRVTRLQIYRDTDEPRSASSHHPYSRRTKPPPLAAADATTGRQAPDLPPPVARGCDMSRPTRGDIRPRHRLIREPWRCRRPDRQMAEIGAA